MVLTMALTGCVADTQPRLQAPEEGSFKLYTPAMANYVYRLEKGATVTLTTSGTPAYGVATPTRYEVQVGPSADAKDWVDAHTVTEGDAPVEVKATYFSLPTVNTQSVITVKDNDLAMGMNYIMGVQSEEDADKYDGSIQPCYIRVKAYVPDPKDPSGVCPYSVIYSNILTLSKVQPYYAVPKGAEIFVIGKYQGWSIDGNDDTVTLSEDENGIGSNIYTGYVWFTAVTAKEGFRFYKQLGNWEANSIGCQVDDQDKQFTISDGVYEGDCVFPGKGNWQITNWPEDGGWMKITVNLNNMSVKFQLDTDREPKQ